MAKTKDKVSDAASTVKPYVDRALHDDELRENVRNAYESARSIYNELIGCRRMTGVAARVATDKDIQNELKAVVAELRSAADRVQGKEEHKGRNGMLLFVGIVLGALFNPVTGQQTREWISNRLFGGADFAVLPRRLDRIHQKREWLLFSAFLAAEPDDGLLVAGVHEQLEPAYALKRDGLAQAEGGGGVG